VVSHNQSGAHREPDLRTDLYPSGEAMTASVHPVILRYASGKLSANQAAGLLGDKATVADVIVMARNAGLEPPRQSPAEAEAELAHARAILGFKPPRSVASDTSMDTES
jgi:hypothetical protein